MRRTGFVPRGGLGRGVSAGGLEKRGGVVCESVGVD